MVEDRADLAYEHWDEDHGCEALTVGLETARPRVFLREGLTYEPRVRFTLAHELGHLVIPWHTGVQGCAPNRSSSGGFELEQQADTFAGGLLLPLSIVRAELSHHGLSVALKNLSAAGMSASAFALSMSRYLLPGFLLVSERGGGNSPMKVWSKGSAPRLIDSKVDAEATSLEHGTVALSGKNVFWYRFVGEQRLPVDDDPRTTSDLLWAALERSGLDDDGRAALFKSLNGIIAGKLSVPRVTAPEAIYATLVHITESDNRFPASVRKTAEFDLFLARKAHERSAKMLV